jgi:hypothetical protein
MFVEDNKDVAEQESLKRGEEVSHSLHHSL